MRENDIVAAIMRYLKAVQNCFAWKQHGGQFGVAGLPDIIICCRGRFIALEVKTATGKLTKLQEVTIAKINSAGGLAVKVTSVDEVKKIIEGLEVYDNDRKRILETGNDNKNPP